MEGYTPNAAACIAMQVGVTASLQGGTGVGKSATMAALARAMGRKLFTYVAGTRGEEEAMGIPFPVGDKYFSRRAPYWVKEINDSPDQWIVMIDEAKTSSPAGFNGIMAMVLEPHRVGDVCLKEGTLFVVVTNPPDICPDGRDYPPTVVTRMCHLNWHPDNKAFLQGLANGCVWADPVIPMVPPDWEKYKVEAGSLMRQFLDRRPDMIRIDEVAPEKLQQPHHCDRTWDFAARCYAGCLALGVQKDGVCGELMEGCLGRGVATEFLEYVEKLDLPNIDDLMAAAFEKQESWKFPHVKDRVDRTIAIMHSVCRRYTEIRDNLSATKKAKVEAWTALATVTAALGEVRPEMLGIAKNFLIPIPEGAKPTARLYAVQSKLAEGMLATGGFGDQKKGGKK